MPKPNQPIIINDITFEERKVAGYHAAWINATSVWQVKYLDGRGKRRNIYSHKTGKDRNSSLNAIEDLRNKARKLGISSIKNSTPKHHKQATQHAQSSQAQYTKEKTEKLVLPPLRPEPPTPRF